MKNIGLVSSANQMWKAYKTRQRMMGFVKGMLVGLAAGMAAACACTAMCRKVFPAHRSDRPGKELEELYANLRNIFR